MLRSTVHRGDRVFSTCKLWKVAVLRASRPLRDDHYMHASNAFTNFIAHDFGRDLPPLVPAFTVPSLTKRSRPTHCCTASQVTHPLHARTLIRLTHVTRNTSGTVDVAETGVLAFDVALMYAVTAKYGNPVYYQHRAVCLGRSQTPTAECSLPRPHTGVALGLRHRAFLPSSMSLLLILVLHAAVPIAHSCSACSCAKS